MGTFSGELLKGYKLDTSIPEFNGGQSNMFKIQAVTQTSSGKPFSVLTTSKSEIKQKITDPENQEKAWQTSVLGAKNLLKLKHPSLLKVEDKIFEQGDKVMVVVERVHGTLATLFHEIYISFLAKINESEDHFGSLEEDEDETRTNVKFLLSGLRFINKDLKYCHYGISPESVFLVGESKNWKLGGLGLMRGIGDVEASAHLRPNLYFISPEHFQKVNSRSDLFSLGLVLLKYFVYNYHLQNSRFLFHFLGFYTLLIFILKIQIMLYVLFRLFSIFPYLY
jgi:serine/threonine protein kinase